MRILAAVRWFSGRAAVIALTTGAVAAVAQNTDLSIAIVRFAVVGDGIPRPLRDEKGDAARGRALIVAHDRANCVLCHAVPENAVPFSGDVGPSLAGVGKRLTAAQLRLRIADNQRVNAQTIMPSYYRLGGLERVAPAYRGKTILEARDVEDLVAYLASLQ